MPVYLDDAFGFHDPDNFSAWQRGCFVEHGLGRIEGPEEGGRAVWVEELRVTVSSVGELLELQRDLGAPVLLGGGRLTVVTEGA